MESYREIQWNDRVSYGDINRQGEYEWGRYYLELANPELARSLFDTYEREAHRLLDDEDVLPAYDLTLKCSHTFNVLNARGAISVSQRTGYIERVRNLARRCAVGYLKQREALGYPLLHRS